MANVEKKGYVDPGWPKNLPEDGTAVSEMLSHLSGASSPYGDDLALPIPPEKLNYVHPYTRINR